MLEELEKRGKLRRKKSDDLTPPLFPNKTVPKQIFLSFLHLFSEILKDSVTPTANEPFYIKLVARDVGKREIQLYKHCFYKGGVIEDPSF